VTRKRILILLGSVCLALVLAVPLVVACAGPAPTTPAPTTPAPTTPAPTATPTPAPAEEVIKWNLQCSFSPGSTSWFVPNDFAERVGVMSNGRLEIKVFPGGAVVPGYEEFQGIREGVLDMAYSAPQYALDMFESAALFSCVSGGLSPVQQLLWYQAGGGRELQQEAFEPFGIVFLNTVAGMGEDWAYTTTPLNTVDDLRKLKMRCAGDGGEILARMSVATVYFPGSEVYESMERGVIDAFEYATAISAWNHGFHEVIDYLYLSLSRAPTDSTGFYVQKASWDELSPDLQKIVEAAAGVERSRYYAWLVNENATYLKKIEDYGVQVLPLPKAIEEAFVEEAKKFYDEKMEGNPFYAKVLESQRAFKECCELASVY